jgi:IclR family pca regulon transcriptional regulator
MGEFVRSLARGLSVIESFGDQYAQLTLSQVAHRTGMARATARRLLMTLSEIGYVGNDGKRYWLMPKVLRLGYAYIASQSQWLAIRPLLEQLCQSVGEATSIAVLDDKEIVYVARAAPPRLLSDPLFVGARLPAHLTAMGRVLLSDLNDEELDSLLKSLETVGTGRTSGTSYVLTRNQKIDMRTKIIAARQEGIARNDEEVELGLRSIAVPIRDASGRITAAMNLSSTAPNQTMDEFEERNIGLLKQTRDLVQNALQIRAR